MDEDVFPEWTKAGKLFSKYQQYLENDDIVRRLKLIQNVTYDINKYDFDINMEVKNSDDFRKIVEAFTYFGVDFDNLPLEVLSFYFLNRVKEDRFFENLRYVPMKDFYYDRDRLMLTHRIDILNYIHSKYGVVNEPGDFKFSFTIGTTQNEVYLNNNYSEETKRYEMPIQYKTINVIINVTINGLTSHIVESISNYSSDNFNFLVIFNEISKRIHTNKNIKLDWLGFEYIDGTLVYGKHVFHIDNNNRSIFVNLFQDIYNEFQNKLKVENFSKINIYTYSILMYINYDSQNKIKNKDIFNDQIKEKTMIEYTESMKARIAF